MSASIIPTDRPSIYESLSKLQRQAIVRASNPPPGIAGFLFDIDADSSIELTSDITDHFVENNTAIQDQIGLKPEQITLRGLVAELRNTPRIRKEITDPVVDALPDNEPLVPLLAPQAQQEADDAGAELFSEDQSVAAQETLFNYFDGQRRQDGTQQSNAFLFFYNLWKARQLFTVETPWGIMTSMAILSLRAEQGEESKYVSDLRITFKKIRFAKDIAINEGELAGRSVPQTSPKSQQGNLPQTDVPKDSESTLRYILGGTTFNKVLQSFLPPHR